MPDSRTLLYCVTAPQSADVLLRGQLKWMAQRGWTVTLLTSPGASNARVAAREGVELVEIPMSREISFTKDLVSLGRILRQLVRSRPDVLNISTPKAALLCGLAGWVLRVPERTYVVRGVRLEGERGVKRRILWATEWLTLKTATSVVAVSPSVRASLSSQGLVDAAAVTVVGAGSSNGVAGEAIAEDVRALDRDSCRRELGLESDAVVAVYVGRLTRDKGIGELAAALRGDACRGISLLTVGAVEDPSLLAELEPLGARWHHVAWRESLAEVFAASDFLVLPTYREGFPNVVLEAASAGLPAVTTSATGAVDSVQDDLTGLLVPPRDVPGLSAAMARLAADPQLRRRLGEAAQEWVLASFRPEDIWTGLENVYLQGSHRRFDDEG